MTIVKVAQVITRMDWGGSTDICRIITNRLDPRKYDVRLITGLTRFPSAKTKEFFADLKEKAISVPELRRQINPFFDALALFRLYRLFRREKFTIVHTHTAKAGILGRIAARAAGVPIVIHTPHGHNFYGYFNPVFSPLIILIERLMAGVTSKITVFTESEKDDLINFGVARPEKVRLIYQGLEMERNTQTAQDPTKIKAELGIRPAERAVGMVGRLEPVKGPKYFIEAAAKVLRGQENVKFIIVGEGSKRQELERQANDLGIRQRCVFAGWQEDAPAIISILDILALPSLNEAVGMVLIEAQAAGVPVIASRVGGVPDVVKDRQTGILVSPADPEELAAAINGLLKDEGLRSRMGSQAREWVRERFKADTMVSAISDLYADMLNRI